MRISQRLLLADSVLNSLIRSGDVSEERVEAVVEANREIGSSGVGSFLDLIEIDDWSKGFDERKEFDKNVHFGEDMLSKMSDVRMKVFDPEPVVSHQQVLEKCIEIAFQEVCEDK